MDAALALFEGDLNRGYLMQVDPREDIIHECHSASCNEYVRQGGASRMSVGFRHVSRELGESYIQIHEDQQTCGHDCAREAIHARIDQHIDIPFGVYDRHVLNPKDEYADSIVKALAEYSPVSTAWSKLPKLCAECQKPLGDEMYLVHLDYSRPAGPHPGMPYMEVVRIAYKLQGLDESIDNFWLAGCTLEHAIKIAHNIVDIILEHVPRANEPHLLEGMHRALALPGEVEVFKQLQAVKTEEVKLLEFDPESTVKVPAIKVGGKNEAAK